MICQKGKLAQKGHHQFFFLKPVQEEDACASQAVMGKS